MFTLFVFQIPTFVYQNHARTVEHAPRTQLTITARVYQDIQERTVRIVRNAHSLIVIFKTRINFVKILKKIIVKFSGFFFGLRD